RQMGSGSDCTSTTKAGRIAGCSQRPLLPSSRLQNRSAMTYQPNRRSFLIAGGLTALASTKAFGANDRLRIGVIGAGGRMRQLLNAAESTGVPFEIVSVNDVYTP